MIPSHLWSQFESAVSDRPMTNNPSEGYNSAFGSTSTGHDSIWTVANKLQSEESLAVTRWRAGLVQVKFGPQDPTFNALSNVLLLLPIF